MFLKHVIRSFKAKAMMLLILGLIIMLSSFVYTIIFSAVGALEETSMDYFSDTNQEDIAFTLSPYLTEDEVYFVSDTCSLSVFELSDLYRQDQTCFNDVISERIEQIKAKDAALDLELRLFRDSHINQDDESHTVRLFKPTDTINKTYLVEGEFPKSDDEIAIIKQYATNHDIALNDTLHIDGKTFLLTGFVLFPDYNLPIINHPFMFDNIYQTLAFVTTDGFNRFTTPVDYHIAGTVDDAFELDNFIEEYQSALPFLTGALLTENNLRSGAIYGELEGSQAMGAFISVLIAVIGIFIVSILMNKTLKQSRSSIGLLKALGIKNSEILWPYLLFIGVFSLVFLLIGYTIGFMFSDALAQFFIAFYLLPEATITFNAFILLQAVFVPFIFLMGLSYYVIKRMLAVDAIMLLSPQIDQSVPKRLIKIKALFNRLSFISRMQLAMILRLKLKAFLFVVSLVFSLFVILLALSMQGVFNDTVIGYYEGLDVKAIGYCELYESCDGQGHDKVLELEGSINNTQTTVIGLDESQTLHPLTNRQNEDLRPLLTEGIVISRSYQILTGIEIEDTVEIRISGEFYTFEVKGVAAIYPGEHIYLDRATLAEKLFDDGTMFNRVYASEALNENDYLTVISIDDLLSQVDAMNDVAYQMIYILIGASLMMGIMIIYLLTTMSVDDQYYAISLLKVKGYNKKEINKIILGGYQKLGVLAFLIAIPLTIGSLNLMTLIFARMYQFIMPLSIGLLDSVLVFVIYGMIYYIGSILAKRKIDRISLQEALKLYQE